MMQISNLFYVVVALFVAAVAGAPCAIGNGTTKHLESIIIGRCEEYQKVINPDLFCGTTTNCTVLWQTFAEAFMNRDPCDAPPERFVALADMMDHEVPVDESWFWHKTYQLVYSMSDKGRRFKDIGVYFPGYMADGVSFCGSPTDGANYTLCPWTTPACPTPAYTGFWTTISTRFAKRARGHVHILLNGSRSVPYSQKSYLGRDELQNMDPNAVTKVTAVIAHNLGGPAVEYCGQGSISTLRDDVIKLGMPFECIDDPVMTRSIQCADDPGHEDCAVLLTSGAVEYTCSFSILVACLIHSIVRCIYI